MYNLPDNLDPEIAKDFWDGVAPEPLVIKLAGLLDSGSSVLDLGAQDGRHAFYLAERGHQEIAVENNPENIELMRRDPRHTQIEIIQSDLRDYEPARQFDAVIAGMVLHFLPGPDVHPSIQRMQSWTKPRGYNLVTAYTTKNPPGKRPYLFRPNELHAIYSDWEVISYQEKPTPWFQLPNETQPRRNEAVWLLARKPA